MSYLRTRLHENVRVFLEPIALPLPPRSIPQYPGSIARTHFDPVRLSYRQYSQICMVHAEAHPRLPASTPSLDLRAEDGLCISVLVKRWQQTSRAE